MLLHTGCSRLSQPPPNDPHFSEALCGFIQTHLPSIEAMELLLLLYRESSRVFTLDAVVEAMQQYGGTRAMAVRSLDAYVEAGLVSSAAQGFRYEPQGAETASLVQQLAIAHKERPVSLIRLIYYLRGHKIQSFADAFRMKKD